MEKVDKEEESGFYIVALILILPFVLMCFYEWFIRDQFGLPDFRFIEFIGFKLFLEVAFTNLSIKPEFTTHSTPKQKFVRYVSILVLGCVFHFFI